MNGLKGKADKNGDNVVSVDELRDYVSSNVPKLTDNKQHPIVDRDNIYLKFGFSAVRWVAGQVE